MWNWNHRQFLWLFYTKSYNFTLWHLVDITSCLIRNSSSSRFSSTCIYLSWYSFNFLTELYFSSHSFPFNPLQVWVRSRTSSWWIRKAFQTIELGSVRCLDIHWIVSLLCYVFDQFLYYFYLFVGLYIYLLVCHVWFTCI